jgi:ferredoxin
VLGGFDVHRAAVAAEGGADIDGLGSECPHRALFPRLATWSVNALAYSLTKRGSVRVVVDPKQCEANALCIGIAPDLFELPDDSDVVVVTRPVVPSDEPIIRHAVLLCPKQALSIEENT